MLGLPSTLCSFPGHNPNISWPRGTSGVALQLSPSLPLPAALLCQAAESCPAHPPLLSGPDIRGPHAGCGVSCGYSFSSLTVLFPKFQLPHRTPVCLFSARQGHCLSASATLLCAGDGKQGEHGGGPKRSFPSKVAAPHSVPAHV